MTSQLQDAERLLRALTRAEKAQVVAWLSRDRSGAETPGIEQTLDVCGGAACIVGTRIPVWVLEGYRRQGVSDAVLLDSYPGLHAEDLVNAWAYVRQHPDAIERAIRANEAAA